MRRSGFLPRTSHSQTSLRAPEPPQRKIFNCIVDDTALIAGVKKSTRDGIRKWNSQGAVRLFVPLHTLNQLLRLKHGTERINADAREAVKWLDEATSVSDPNTAASVQLQGVDETYPTWAEVEKHLLPETLLSMEDSASDEDDYHEDLESSFNALDVSDQTSVSSSHSYEDVPKTPEMPICALRKDSMAPKSVIEDAKLATLTIESPDRTARNSIEVARSEKSPNSAVPVHFQPLFNHIMWLVNKESNPDAALESYILLTNDPAKQAIAQKFGIRAKRLEQLRDAVAREDREYKNHLTMHKIEAEGTTTKEKAPLGISKVNERPKSSPADCKPHDHSDDEDVVLFQRAPRGPAAITKNQRVFDPNDFGRTNQIHAPRGGRGGHAAPRGRGNTAFRGRGDFTPRGAYVAPGSAARAPAPAPVHDPTQPLDPESFARPMPKGGPTRGGARRKLWEPN